MTETEVIDRIAAETELEPEAVERVLEAAGESVRQGFRDHAGDTVKPRGGERSVALGVALGLLMAEGERDAGGLVEVIAAAAAAWQAHEQGLGALVEALTPEQLELPTPAAVLQARRNVEARSALLQEFGALDSGQVAELAGSRATNRAALANRWRAEQRVLAVPMGDELLYPGFQFTAEGKPVPAVGSALRELRTDPRLRHWQAALWFAGPNGWLGGRRPVDLLDAEPDAVVEAARREAAGRVF
jgi:Protein of unknown function (DUF2384)